MTELPPFPHETLDDEHFFGLLDGIGNHEAKLVTAALLGSQPDDWFTRNSLHKALISCQGASPARIMNQSLPGRYCEKSLEPISAVVSKHIETPQGPVLHYRSTRFGKTWGLGFSGGGMDWSLEFPDTSVQKLLGDSSSPSARRSPETRLGILSGLLDDHTGDISIPELALSLSPGDHVASNVNVHVHRLERQGVVEVTSVVRDYNPIYRIDDPTFRHSRFDITDTQPATQVIYQVMDRLSQAGETEAAHERILDVCLELSPEIQYQRSADAWLMPRATTADYPGWTTGRAGTPVKVIVRKLKSEYVDPVAGLCSALDRSRDPSYLPDNMDRARAILFDPAACYALMFKAMRFSAKHAGATEGSEVLKQQILGIIRSLGSASTQGVTVELQKGGKDVSRSSVYKILGSLADQGLLISKNGAPRPPYSQTNEDVLAGIDF